MGGPVTLDFMERSSTAGEMAWLVAACPYILLRILDSQLFAVDHVMSTLAVVLPHVIIDC
jgi:hypothetical protein